MQSTSTTASKSSSTPEITPTVSLVEATNLLIPFSDQSSYQPSAISAPLALDGDVSLLDSANASDIPSAGVNDDVQLLHSPPAKKSPEETIAPSLAEILVKFEDIKPSIIALSLALAFPNNSYYLGTTPSITLLSQESGVHVSLHSATANIPKVSKISLQKFQRANYFFHRMFLFLYYPQPAKVLHP